MRQHAYLPAMVRVVHDHVGKHGSAGGPRPCPAVAMEMFHVAAGEGTINHLYATFRTLGQSSARLTLRAVGAVKLRRQLDVRCGKPQPFAPDVVHVREDRDDRASLAAGRLCSPGSWIEMRQDQLIHPLTDGIAFQKRFTKLRGG